MLKFFNILVSTIFIALLLGVAGLLVGSMLPIPGNVEIKIVKSGSMEPAIPTGSLVVVKPSPSFSYGVGDVITFGADTKTEVPTTHRIVAVEGAGSERIFITKGDANEDIDQESVALREVVGKVLFSVPGAGYVLAFAREPLGFALLVGIPAGLIILEELLTIGKEVRAAFRRRRGKDDDPKGGGASLDEDGAPLRLFYGRKRMMDEIFVPMYQKPGFMHAEWWHTQFRMHKDTYGTSTALVLGLVFMSSMMAGGAGNTIAYFSDIERSVGNMFRAGEWELPGPSEEDFAFAAVLGAAIEKDPSPEVEEPLPEDSEEEPAPEKVEASKPEEEMQPEEGEAPAEEVVEETVVSETPPEEEVVQESPAEEPAPEPEGAAPEET